MTTTTASVGTTATWRIMVATLKGGVAKTMTATMLAMYFASLGLRVVLICADAKHRGATKWTNRIVLADEQPPYIFTKWEEQNGPLGMFAREQERAHNAQVLIIDGGNEKETFTHGCMYADWLISPVQCISGELDGIPDTYKFAESVQQAGSPLQMHVLLTRSPQRGKGAALRARNELQSSPPPEEYDPEIPWTLGLDVLDTEISRSMGYTDLYGTVPDNFGEYEELGIELMKMRTAHTKEPAAS